MFDPLDPWSWVQNQQAQPGQPGQKLKLENLSPPEEESLLSRLGTKTLGGLGYVGSVLDKTFGGRAIRGVLGGKPEELASIIPFSDTLGITDERNKVSGKELLGLQHDDSWGSTLAGMGTDIALDPATYLTFGLGALTKSGKAAQMAGTLPATQMERIAQGMQGVAGMRVPFTNVGFQMGAGQGGKSFLEGIGTGLGYLDKGISHVPGVGGLYGKAKEGLQYAGRMGNALFDPAVMDATTAVGQQAAREASALQGPLRAGWNENVARWAKELEAAGAGGTGAELRNVLEGVGAQSANPEVLRVGQEIRASLQQTLDRLQALGHDTKPLEDLFAKYAPRQFTLPGQPSRAFGGGGQALQEELLGRKEFLKNLPRGSESINQMALDPLLSGPARTAKTPLQAEQHLLTTYQDMGPVQNQIYALNQKAAGGTLTAAEVAQRDALVATLKQNQGQAKELAAYLHGLPPEIAATVGSADPWRLIGRHPLEDLLAYGGKASRAESTAQAAQNLIARTAQAATPYAPGAEKMVSVAQALREAGLTGAEAENALMRQLQQGAHGPMQVPGLAQMQVPASTLDELGRFARGTRPAEPTSKLISAWDWLTNWTKGGQTLPFPGFHMRNLASGQFQNVGHAGLEGMSALEAKALIAGEVLPNANKIPGYQGLTPQAATEQLRRELFSHGGMDYGMAPARELAGGKIAGEGLQGSLETLLSRIPGESPRTLGGAAKELGGNWNPATAGMEKWAPFAAGRHAGDVVEGTNRAALYLQLRKQGFSAEEAGRQILETHFNYAPSGKTTFEREVMSRLVPFYSYMRGNIPYQVQQLGRYPGGLGGQVIRAGSDLRQQEGFLPDYLGQGLAVPIGGEQGGTRRYLTRTDLPPEQAFEMLRGGPNWLQNSMLGALGQTNALVRAPVEYAFGKQAFTGRELPDLYSQTGNQLLDTIIMNSPVGRLATTARTVTDPRKWQDPYALPLNLGTGLKVSDIDMAKQRGIAGREMVQEFLRGQPEIGRFTNIYVRPGMEGQISPEELQLLRLNKTLEARALQAARARQQAGQ